MNADTGKTPTAREVNSLRDAVRRIRAEEGLSWKDIENESGIASGTFSPWLDGKYPGDNGKVALRVRGWLENRERGNLLRASVPTVPSFRLTPTSARIIKTLETAHLLGDMAVIGMGPGLGKTSSIIQYKATRPLVFVATMSPATRGVNTMLTEVCEAVGETESKGTPAVLSKRVTQKLRGKQALMVIDEAQHLSEQAFEQLRSIHDETEVGIALIGNEDLYAKLDGTGRTRSFSQLTSRIGHRLKQSIAIEGDIVELAAGWNITDDSQIDFLCRIGLYPGALRGVTKTMKMASMLAGSAQEPVSEKYLKAAWSRVGSGVEGAA